MRKVRRMGVGGVCRKQEPHPLRMWGKQIVFCRSSKSPESKQSRAMPKHLRFLQRSENHPNLTSKHDEIQSETFSPSEKMKHF